MTVGALNGFTGRFVEWFAADGTVGHGLKEWVVAYLCVPVVTASFFASLDSLENETIPFKLKRLETNAFVY